MDSTLMRYLQDYSRTAATRVPMGFEARILVCAVRFSLRFTQVAYRFLPVVFHHLCWCQFSQAHPSDLNGILSRMYAFAPRSVQHR